MMMMMPFVTIVQRARSAAGYSANRGASAAPRQSADHATSRRTDSDALQRLHVLVVLIFLLRRAVVVRSKRGLNRPENKPCRQHGGHQYFSHPFSLLVGGTYRAGAALERKHPFQICRCNPPAILADFECLRVTDLLAAFFAVVFNECVAIHIGVPGVSRGEIFSYLIAALLTSGLG